MVSGRWRLVTLTSLLLVCVALVALTMQLRSSERTVHAQEAALAAQRLAIEVNKDAVTELCRTNGILRGLIEEAVSFREDQIKAGRVPKDALPRTKIALSIYRGYIARLNQQTACREVIRP